MAIPLRVLNLKFVVKKIVVSGYMPFVQQRSSLFFLGFTSPNKQNYYVYSSITYPLPPSPSSALPHLSLSLTPSCTFHSPYLSLPPSPYLPLAPSLLPLLPSFSSPPHSSISIDTVCQPCVCGDGRTCM